MIARGVGEEEAASKMPVVKTKVLAKLLP